MIDITYDSREMTDFYLLFNSKEDAQAYLQHECEPSARFKACDYVDYSTSGSETNGISKRTRENLTIKTNAMLDFTKDAFLYDVKYEQMWRVVDFTTADDGQMKELSLRPRKFTILTLVA